MNKQFTLTAVKPLAGTVLQMTFADGATMRVDVAPIVKRSPVLLPLLEPAVFKRAKLGEWGGSVTWGADVLELAADNLRARAVEQAGGYSHELVMEWMHRNKLTQNAAAAALGISRRMLGYYLSGEKDVPRTVALACLGWEVALKLSDERFVVANSYQPDTGVAARYRADMNPMYVLATQARKLVELDAGSLIDLPALRGGAKSGKVASVRTPVQIAARGHAAQGGKAEK